MSRGRLWVVVGFALGCAGAFLAGRHAMRSGSFSFAAAPPGGRISDAAGASASVEADHFPARVASAHPELARLGQAFQSALRSHAAPEKKAEWFSESAAQRADRHEWVNRKIDETLGDIPPKRRQALIELNDEATDVQLGLQSALMAGQLSQSDFDQQMQQRVMVQLDQLRGILSDDEYRKVTGLEPGVDPVEYMRTGIGGAHSATVVSTAVSADAPPKEGAPY